VLILALLIVLIAPASASAATVTAHESCDKSLCWSFVDFTAAPGEANTLTGTYDAGAITFTDVVPIRAGNGCTVIVGGARCAAPYGLSQSGLTVKLADRDDVATFNVPAAVYGGAGNDRITGSGSISGGPGSDELTATAVTAFRDDDGAQPAPDRYIGSAANGDGVSYAGRKTAIDVDLGRSENAGDVFTSIEAVEGGAGDDRLIGTAGRNRLTGGPGTDLLNGLDGNDELNGDARDRLVGDAGDDDLNGGKLLIGGAGDDSLAGGKRSECGEGNDEAWLYEAGAFVRSDCEKLETVGNVSDVEVHAPPGAFLIKPECYCRYARWVATAGGVVVARAGMRHKTVGYKHWPLSLRLNARGRKLLAARGRLRITVSIVERYEVGYGSSRERFRTDIVQPM
jgi:hypothetical protein